MLALCRWALALYPHAWRARYGAELTALLEERRLSLGTLVDLVRGACDAHLDSRGMVASPRQRMRGTVAATLGSWIAIVVLGAGFANATEDIPFRAAERAHPLLGDAWLAVVALALASGAVVVLAGAPMAYAVLRQAWRERTPALVRALGASLAGVAFLVATSAGLVLYGEPAAAPPYSPGARSLGHMLFVVYVGCIVLVAIVGALAARTGVMRARFHAGQLVLGVAGAWLLARIMAALTLAVALYTVLLALESPSLAASPSGPFAVSTTIELCSQVVGMILVSGVAAVTTRRGARALLGR